jgi:hypothetical protein
MKSTIIRFGLYSFVFSAVLFTLGLVFGENLDYGTREIIGYTSIVLCLLFVFFGIKHYRDKENEGSISFVKGFLIGLAISALAGVGVAVVDAIYTTFINPDFFDEYAQMMKDQGKEDEIMEIGSAMMATIMFLTVFMIGIIISLISALILQRKN